MPRTRHRTVAGVEAAPQIAAAAETEDIRRRYGVLSGMLCDLCGEACVVFCDVCCVVLCDACYVV